MKFLFFCIIHIFFLKTLTANQLETFNWDSKGNVLREEVVSFPSGKKFISFKHAGGFETTIAKYGAYSCTGNMFYDKIGSLEDMNYACEFKDQNGDKFYATGSRKKGSTIDRSLGTMIIVEGKGYWKAHEKKICTYALEKVDQVVFVKSSCK